MTTGCVYSLHLAQIQHRITAAGVWQRRNDDAYVCVREYLWLSLEATSVCVYVCDVSCPFPRPDDSSRFYYIQESVSFCLWSEREKKTKAGGGEERCSLSIVIKHDRMQFQSAASVPAESRRCLDRTLLSFCPLAINTLTDVLFSCSCSVVDGKSQRPDSGRRRSQEEEKRRRTKSRSDGK